MKIFGYDFNYRRVVLYKKVKKPKKNFQEDEEDEISNFFINAGIKVETVKYRQWWYQWYATWVSWIFVIPLFLIPYWIYKHQEARKKIFKYLQDGYKVSDDFFSKTIVVQFAGFPLEIDKDVEFIKKSELSEIKRDLRKYAKGKLTKKEEKVFEKKAMKYWNSYKFMLKGTKFEKKLRKNIQKNIDKIILRKKKHGVNRK